MSERIRCFIAIELPEDLKNQIGQYISELRPLAPEIKWVRKNALHITLKFLGEIPSARVDQIVAALMPLHQQSTAVNITITGLGAFPNEKRPRVIWLGIEPNPRDLFFELHHTLEGYLEAIGVEREKRKFSPHLTLARIKIPQEQKPLFTYVKEHPFQAYSFSVHDIVLMRSILKPVGAEYRVIQKYPLHP